MVFENTMGPALRGLTVTAKGPFYATTPWITDVDGESANGDDAVRALE